ncbi:MAG: PAS domain S-box protein, partial [Promethearchaeota archaeon]
MENQDLSFKVSEQTYEKIFQNSQYPSYIWKKEQDDMILIKYNKKVDPIKKNRMKNLKGVKATNFYSENPQIIKNLFLCVNTKVNFSKKIQYRYKSEDKIAFLIIFYNYISPDMVFVNIQDITTRTMAKKALKRSEIEKKLILDSISELIAFQDLNHNLIWVNKRAVESVESTSEDLVGRKCFKVWNELDHPCKGCPIEKAIKTGKREHNQIKDPFGQYWDIKAFPVRSESGKFIGVVEVTENITDRIKTEEALKSSEEKYKVLFHNTGTATSIIEEDTTILIVNNRFEELTGYNKREVEGKMSWIEFLVKEDLERIKQYHYNRRKDPTLAPKTYETSIKNKNGEVKHVILNVDMISGTTQSVASLTDITYQKMIQNELKESEEKFKLIAEQSLMGIMILQDDRFKYVNQQFINKSGYSQREIRNWGPGEFLKLIHPDYREFVKQQAQKKQKGDKDYITHYIFKAVRKNGEIYWEEIYSKPIKY